MPYLGSSPPESALTTGNLGDDIVTLAKLAGGTDGNIISYDSSGNPVAIATGNDGQVLTSAGAGAQPAFETIPGGGKILQVVSYTVRTVVTGSTDMPNDNSVPQNGEGTEIVTGAITPASATNKLLFLVNLQASINAATWGVAGLFQDTTAGALAASYAYCPANGGGAHIAFTHYMDAGTTSSTTFKLRAGAQSGSNTITINGNAGNQTMGGVAHTGFQIWEIQV